MTLHRCAIRGNNSDVKRNGSRNRLDLAGTKLNRAPVKRSGPGAKVSDSGMKWNEKNMYWHAAVPPHCPLSPATLPNGTVGIPYSPIPITASGGTSPYSFTVISGSLPPGLTLTSGGVLSGTPTSFGSFTFTIQATDSHGCTGTRHYHVTVLF